NLVHNAIVHNSGAPATVSVRTGREPGWVVLTVENTGALLDPHVVTGLTERFRRGSGRVRSDHDGIGLGLAIVKSISDAHDGSLTLQARAEGGLRVVVRLRAG
ncbi:sensor histidine kinase, partial [Pseudactinotalea sp.]|uniref:sensor histidine kinase n=1 Tax=Pseudactinotalea sp. TaxID=1926260 RepID=UPI003B3B29B7